MAERIEGEVDYFNEVGSYGFIMSDAEDAPDKDVFFDMDDVGGPDLEEGERITFEYKMAERGPRATDVYRDGEAPADEDAGDAGDAADDEEEDDTDTTVYAGGDGGDDADVRLGVEAYEDLRAQMVDAFGGAEFPVANPMELVPALPDGSDTLFEADDFSMTVVELTSELDTDNYPYGDVESFVDDVFAHLESSGAVRLPDAATVDGADEGGAGDADGDATNVYDGGSGADSAADGGAADSAPEDGWEPIYRYCSSCGTDLRKYGRITSGNFCPACGSLIGE